MTTTDEPRTPRRRRTARLVAGAIGVMLALLVVVLATRKPAESKIDRSPLVGHEAPALAGSTIDGGTFRLADRRGQWVLVNFFATWCVPCRIEHPELVQFAKRHADAGDASVVGVIFSDDVAAVRRFRASKGGTWPMLLDPDGAIAVAYGVARVPESYLISPDGVVVAKFTGGVRDVQLESYLEHLLSTISTGG